MRAFLLAFALPSVLAGFASDAGQGGQVPFVAGDTHNYRPTTQERYDGQSVKRFNLQGMSRDWRDMLVHVLNVSGAAVVVYGPVVLCCSVVRQQLGERHRCVRKFGDEANHPVI